MPLGWADELANTEPDPKLEAFFTLAALELGDPDAHHWLRDNCERFYKLYASFIEGRELPASGVEALIQYMVWYPREVARIKP